MASLCPDFQTTWPGPNTGLVASLTETGKCQELSRALHTGMNPVFLQVDIKCGEEAGKERGFRGKPGAV